MSQLRIYVEVHPNHEIRDYHLSQLVYFKQFSSYSEKGLPKKIEALERRLNLLPQLQEDSFTGRVSLKSIRVKLNPTYTWDELHVAVVDVITRYFKTDDVLINIMERNPEWDRPRTEREDMY